MDEPVGLLHNPQPGGPDDLHRITSTKHAFIIDNKVSFPVYSNLTHSRLCMYAAIGPLETLSPPLY